ncbi:MAG: hypothetical protein HYV35_12960 [Lentisphaerae bacterium]|nr:hypothetical protein [Lentisphaerota bacterium]
MERGILTAVLVTAAWITVQIFWMHFKPARNRSKAMFLGYGLSLPFVYIAFRWLPGLSSIALDEPWGIGLFFAYFLHLLLFFLYAECFYHVERSVTLRLLVDILQRAPSGKSLTQILAEYNVRDMVQTRLAILCRDRFIEERNGHWRLQAKGRRLVKVLRISTWIFQSTTQAERL